MPGERLERSRGDVTRSARGYADLPPGPARDLVDLLRRLRLRRELSVGQIAVGARLSRSHVSEVLRGWKTPSPRAAAAIARELGANEAEAGKARHWAGLARELLNYQRTHTPPSSARQLPQVALCRARAADDWNIYLTSEVAAWLDGLQAAHSTTAGRVDDAIYALSRSGPALGRPLVDAHVGSKIRNLRELRPGSSGTSEVRILFALDPSRSAILLIAGDQAGRWSRWYWEALPRAEHLHDLYLKERAGGAGGAISSCQQWDRAVYVERTGGVAAAEQRRQAILARQSGHRLAGERRNHGLAQARLAEAMGVTPALVSQVERGEAATIEVIARYIEALGGRLDLIATFGDHTVTISGPS